MMTVLNTFSTTGFTCLVDKDVSVLNAVIYGFTKEVISAQLGGGLAGFAAGILGGMVVTKVMDPEHRVDFPTAMKAVGYLGMSQIFWAILGVGVAMAAGNELR